MSIINETKAWQGFETGAWIEYVDVRDFIRKELHSFRGR